MNKQDDPAKAVKLKVPICPNSIIFDANRLRDAENAGTAYVFVKRLLTATSNASDFYRKTPSIQKSIIKIRT